jgi:2-oxoglutarate ferredoxin oxidoreductase subunit delta
VTKVVIDQIRCKGCMLCAVNCPKKILVIGDKVNQDGYRVAVCEQDDACIGCLNCAYICPSACFEIYREEPVAVGE